MKNNWNKAIIASCYGLLSINLLACWIFKLISSEVNDTSLLILAIMLIIMVPISIIDHRKEMNGSFAVLCSIVLHLVVSVAASILLSCGWLLLLTIIESIILLALAFTKRSR